MLCWFLHCISMDQLQGYMCPLPLLFACCCCCYVASVVSDSVQPHRRQPTGLPRPWDSPGKNTGVGCHVLLQCMKAKSEREVTQLCQNSWRPHGLQPTRLLRPWDFPGKRTGLGCHCLLRHVILGGHKKPIEIICDEMCLYYTSWFSKTCYTTC